MPYHPFDKEVAMQYFDAQTYLSVVTSISNPHTQFSSIFPLYQQAFHVKAEQSSGDAGDLFVALAMVCSIRFETSGNGQYKPFCIMDGRRSFLPEDLPSNWQAAMREIATHLNEHPLLQARLLDVVYLGAPKKDFQLVKEIITALGKTDVLTEDGYGSWWRMFGLLKTMGSSLSNELEKEQQRLYEILQGLSVNDTSQVVHLTNIARLVIEQDLFSTSERQTIADALKQAANIQTEQSDFLFDEQLYSLAHDFYVLLDQNADAHEMLRQRAKSYINSGLKRMSEDPTAYFVQMNFSEKALQVLRSIPNAARTPQDVEQIDELARQIPLLGQHASQHIQSIESPFDVSEIATTAAQFVQGLEIKEAIVKFVMLCPFSYANSRKTAINGIKEDPLTSMVQSSLMHNGRTVAKSPALDLNDNDGAEAAIWEKMVKNHHQFISFHVTAKILPALRTILSEHQIPIEGLHYLTEQSKFVPLNRRASWAKGLMFGFNWDFSTALYCLSPQIEHMVRDALEQRDLKTTTIFKDGTADGVGLSALLKNHHEACISIFGEDIMYEMKMLFCDSWGANLRNTVAHGLLDDSESDSADAVYAWWFALKVCVLGAVTESDDNELPR
jgi:hypothetical protein